MNFEFQKARDQMVENQLRPNKINNPIILNLFKKIKKEDFLLDDLKLSSYNDLDIKKLIALGEIPKEEDNSDDSYITFIVYIDICPTEIPCSS